MYNTQLYPRKLRTLYDYEDILLFLLFLKLIISNYGFSIKVTSEVDEKFARINH